MAAVDKIYGTNEQYDIFCEWAQKNKPELIEYFYPRDGYRNVGGRPITNLPAEYDEWLLQNCPLHFVVEAIRYQYDLPDGATSLKM